MTDGVIDFKPTQLHVPIKLKKKNLAEMKFDKAK